MESRDAFDRAGASLRERAADLARGHDADEVVRLGGRRRVWQGATAGVATLAIVVGILNGLPEPSVDRIAIDPLAPSDAAGGDPEAGNPDGTAAPADAGADVATEQVCDPGDLTDAPAHPAAVGTAAAAAAAPAAVAHAPLLAVGDHAYALDVWDAAGFAVFGFDDGWRCLPSPDLPAPRVAVAGPGTVLAMSRSSAARFDTASERWSDVRLPDTTAIPVAGVWTGQGITVAFDGDDVDPGALWRYEPTASTWQQLPTAPVRLTGHHYVSLYEHDGDVVLFGGTFGNRSDGDRPSEVLAAFEQESATWSTFPRPPLVSVAGRPVVVDGHLVAADDSGQWAALDLESRSWSEPAPIGIDADPDCPPQLLGDGEHVLLTACGQAAVLDGPDGSWTPFPLDEATSPSTVLADGTFLAWRDGGDGTTELLALSLVDLQRLVAAGVEECAAVSGFGRRLADSGIAADEAAPTTPAALADDVDLVVAGTLTGEVEVANGPGPAGESYLAYALTVTDVVSGEAAVGDTVRVSVAFDGEPTRSAEMTRDVPAGASVAVFAYEVTDAPGGWVAADGDGFAVACPGGPPLGQVGSGPGWSGLADLDALLDAARH